MQSVPTLTAAYCRVLIDYLGQHRRRWPSAVPAVLEVLGVSAAQLNEADRRVPRRRFNQALECAMQITGDAYIGLHAGEHIRPAHYGVLGYLMMSCDTLRQVIDRHARWHQLVAGGEVAEYEVRDQRLWLRETLPAELITRAGVECNLASALSFARWIAGQGLRPDEVHLPYPAPDDLSEYHRLLRCRLHFDSPGFALVLPVAMLDAPLPQADVELRQIMEARAGRQAAELGIGDDAFLSQLRRYIATQLPSRLPDIDAAAQALNLSVRTLQRRLGARDTHFKRLLDDTRRELAIDYVGDPQLSLVDIAFLLGFSEQSALNRAFRRWTQRTPLDYRAGVVTASLPPRAAAG